MGREVERKYLVTDDRWRQAVGSGVYYRQGYLFAGENQGLVIAAVETGRAPEEIPKPEWVGEDVTDDPRYSNVNLVKQPYSHWKQPEYR